MRKSQKTTSQQQIQNLLAPITPHHFSPELSPLARKPLARKTSMIELHKVECDEVKIVPQRVLPQLKTKKQLLSQQNPRNEKKERPRVETSECQFRGLDFTFAGNFSSKQQILKEFSAHALRRKFFV